MSTSPPAAEKPVPVETPLAADHWLEMVERQVGALKFGSVQITVHEGRVVQVETNVRVRFDKTK